MLTALGTNGIICIWDSGQRRESGMTNKKRYLMFSPALMAIVVLALASFPSGGFAQSDPQSQSEQQPTSGPQPHVGETVLVPKKTQPAPVQPEKKVEKINPNDIYTLSTSTNLVNVDVMVVDNSGNPIPSLGKKNFQVFDDGVPQAITNFGTGEAPMTICMLIEFSNRWWGYLYLALQDAYNFLNVIQPKDWVAVVSFDMKPEILTDFTQNRSEVRAALDSLRIPGFSEYNLYDSLAFILDRMKEVHGRKAILAIVTGLDSFSKLTYDQCLKIVRASDTAIYPVSILEFMAVRSPYGGNISTLQAQNALNTIAKYSGGQAYFPRFEGELPDIYQQIARQLRTQYSLGFIPTNAVRDGKFHKLKVDLVDDQGNPLRIVNEKGKVVKYRIVARDGYYAPKS
jgi:Ca-activated chloride channel family protein